LMDWVTHVGKFEEFLIGIIFMLLYFIVMEVTFSRTLGKYITKTIVVMEDGSKPDTATIIKRTLCRFIPFDGLSYFGTPSRGWHDSISDTWVVKKEEFEREKELFYSFEEIGNNDN
ncbi:MAG: RDD family protein, partial [Flavobacterium sp.]